MQLRLVAVLLAVTLGLGGFVDPLNAQSAGPVLVSIRNMAPTQVEAGYTAVRQMVDSSRQEAARSGLDWATYVKSNLVPNAERSEAIPAVVDPSGTVRPLDSHHRILKYQLIQNELAQLGESVEP